TDRKCARCASSDVWTQRMALSGTPSTARSRSNSSRRLLTVSTVPGGSGPGSKRLLGRDLFPGLFEDGAQDLADLLELLAAAGQRRGELDDGVAAIVGTADQ